MEDIGLYDSQTNEDIATLKVVDVTADQTRAEKAELLFARAKRGRIVQLRTDGMRIHYFLDEPSGHKMMTEDAERFGFAPGRFHVLALHHAPA
jgi:DNA repair exonuclease SbcCD nuclease subunit